MLKLLQQAVSEYTDRAPGESPYFTQVPGFAIMRSNHARRPRHMIYRPSLCIAVQGSKRSIFGNRRFLCKAGQALLVNVEMPARSNVVEASPKRPYLGMVIQLDTAILRQVLSELPEQPASAPASHGASIIDLAGPLTDCALRMVRLLDTPEATPILYPAIMREICYWLLTGPSAAQVIQATSTGTAETGIMHAIHTLRSRFNKSVTIEELAAIAKMGTSAFHRHFKAVTSMTPLQYQKQMRLLEARRMMATDAINAENAAFHVGYESPSQFSREYARMFGAPPRRDIIALQKAYPGLLSASAM
ncbi:AraC family transcriptional regulator [Silvibacterium acidisoli]|uniref:AraC family transcriptional regulator n=1 Tax=Acidobacteriaceae bacterium ZG23-2 TaxID=2883246 RepID=UPI00406D4679